MAWAVDCNTQQPVYIMDLDESRAGSKSGCECPSCGLPLTGVNVAKTEYQIRPHFRHPNGAAESADCTFQAARIAALELLKSQGVLELPSRRVRGQVVGISGTVHEVWVHKAAERVKIRDFNFQDKTFAILTLEDGKLLRILITGSGISAGPSGFPHLPTIQLELNLPGIAALSLDELRNRLMLVPDENCWVSHWADTDLAAQAEEEARLVAEEHLDDPNMFAEELKGVDPKFRRETLLHLECKRILQDAAKVKVPSLEVFINEPAEDGREFEGEWYRPEEYLALLDIKLEKKVGEGIPDLSATIPEDRGGTLLIEVTVTNHLNDLRRRRFAATGVPALEIDLSNLGGHMTRKELATWVIHGLVGKEWIYHPHSAREHLRLMAGVRSEVEAYEDALHEARALREKALAVKLDDATHEYLDAVYHGAELGMLTEKHPERKPEYELAKSRIKTAASVLSVHGYPEAADVDLVHSHDGIIPRILAIRNGGGVCYDVHNLAGVMNAIKNLGEHYWSNVTIYLIAERSFWGASGLKTKWFTEWAGSVRDAIKRGDNRFIRDGKYDRLLALLFPELLSGLANGFGSRRTRDGTPKRARELMLKR